MPYNRPLSHSSISLYLECPQKFKFRYIDKLPEAPKWFFSFGQSLHAALEFFYSVKALPAPTLEQLLAFYKDNWRKEGYKSPQQELEYFADGRRILEEFYRLHIDSYRIPYFAEYKFDLEVDGVPVTGFVDRIDKLGNGNLAVIDYKTGKDIKLDRVEGDPQLTLYQMAVEQLLGAKVETLTFYHLPSQRALTTRPRAADKIEALRERIVDVHSRIQAERFDPDPEEKKCQWCDYRPHCPVFRSMYAAPPPAAPVIRKKAILAPAADSDQERLAALVDRYGDLRGQEQQIQSEIEELKAEIVSLLRKNGYVRAFGNRFEVSAQAEKRWDFRDRGKVLEALRRHGLYEKVLKPSAPEVYRLLESPELPEAAREEIERLGERRDTESLELRRLD